MERLKHGEEGSNALDADCTASMRDDIMSRDYRGLCPKDSFDVMTHVHNRANGNDC